MKFILIIQICSIMAGACDNTSTIDKQFDSYRDCAMFGYEMSLQFLQQMDPNELNKQQIYTRFSCKEHFNI
jgi:hypothetical protein